MEQRRSFPTRRGRRGVPRPEGGLTVVADAKVPLNKDSPGGSGRRPLWLQRSTACLDKVALAERITFCNYSARPLRCCVAPTFFSHFIYPPTIGLARARASGMRGGFLGQKFFLLWGFLKTPSPQYDLVKISQPKLFSFFHQVGTFLVTLTLRPPKFSPSQNRISDYPRCSTGRFHQVNQVFHCRTCPIFTKS